MSIVHDRCAPGSHAVSLCVPLLHDPSEALLMDLHQRVDHVLTIWQRHAVHARRVGLLNVTYVLTDETRALADR